MTALESISRAVNWLCGGTYPETLCCRIGRADACGNRLARIAARVLDVIEADHCARSVRWHAAQKVQP